MKCHINMVFVLAIALMANSANAVDGYKDLKFGMSKQDVIKAKPCDIKRGNSIGPLDSQFCENFSFGGAAIDADFYFIDEKLEAITLYVGADRFLGIVTSLVKKFGKPSSRSTNKEFEVVNYYPNQSAFFAFAGDTVRLDVVSNEYAEQGATLSYFSDSYYKKLAMAQANDIKDDL